MKLKEIPLIVAALLVLACFPLVSAPGDEPGSITEIHFCHFEVPQHVKSMNASFSITYSLEVDQDGRPVTIKKLDDPFLESGSVTACLEKWRMPGVQPNAEILITAQWRHGVGWMQISIVGKTIRQRIIRSGDLSPYRGGQGARVGN